MNDLLAILGAALRGLVSVMRDDHSMMMDVVAPRRNRPPAATREELEADLERLYAGLTQGRTAEDDAYDEQVHRERVESAEFWNGR